MDKEKQCENCEGTGKIYRDEFNSNRGHWESVHQCPDCEGTGYLYHEESDSDA